MPSFTNLLVVMAMAFAAPLLLRLFPRVQLPSVVLEIVVGPSVLGIAEVDQAVQVVGLSRSAACCCSGAARRQRMRAPRETTRPLR
jgi:hypothetical protein